MKDHATEERKKFIKSLKNGVTKDDLGKSHVLHPEYEAAKNPAHLYNGSYILSNWLADRLVSRHEM